MPRSRRSAWRRSPTGRHARLSAGQKRRLALSRLALSDAPLWLLDEPVTALDTEARAAFVALLKRHLAAGRLAIIATHEPLAIEAPVMQIGARAMSAFVALLKRDLVLSLRQGIDAWVVVLFFLAAGILFPFAIGPEPDALMQVSTGVVLSMAALAALLSLDRLYQGDFEDGSLDLMALGPLPLELAALAKALAHWLSTGLPLLVAAPLLALMLNAPAGSYWPMLLALALATPALSLLGGLGAALDLGQPARRHPAHVCSSCRSMCGC